MPAATAAGQALWLNYPQKQRLPALAWLLDDSWKAVRRYTVRTSGACGEGGWRQVQRKWVWESETVAGVGSLSSQTAGWRPAAAGGCFPPLQNPVPPPMPPAQTYLPALQHELLCICQELRMPLFQHLRHQGAACREG